MNHSPLTCTNCPGHDRCPIAEAEDCLAELAKGKIRKEIADIRWMLSLGNDGLDVKDQLLMSSLLSKLQRLLVNGSPADLFSVSRQIVDAQRQIA